MSQEPEKLKRRFERPHVVAIIVVVLLILLFLAVRMLGSFFPG